MYWDRFIAYIESLGRVLKSEQPKKKQGQRR